MSDDIPAAWRPYLERRGITASYRGIGDRADVSHETARRVVTGRSISPVTAAKVAAALGVDAEVVYALRREAPERAAVWEPPAESSLLTPDERELLNRLVHMLAAGRRHQDGGDDERTVTTTPGTEVTLAAPEPEEQLPGASRQPPAEHPRRGRR